MTFSLSTNFFELIMLDAHFDISSIFRSEIFVPVAIGILSGLICYVVTGNLLQCSFNVISLRVPPFANRHAKKTTQP